MGVAEKGKIPESVVETWIREKRGEVFLCMCASLKIPRGTEGEITFHKQETEYKENWKNKNKEHKETC